MIEAIDSRGVHVLINPRYVMSVEGWGERGIVRLQLTMWTANSAATDFHFAGEQAATVYNALRDSPLSLLGKIRE